MPWSKQELLVNWFICVLKNMAKNLITRYY